MAINKTSRQKMQLILRRIKALGYAFFFCQLLPFYIKKERRKIPKGTDFGNYRLQFYRFILTDSDNYRIQFDVIRQISNDTLYTSIVHFCVNHNEVGKKTGRIRKIYNIKYKKRFHQMHFFKVWKIVFVCMTSAEVFSFVINCTVLT